MTILVIFLSFCAAIVSVAFVFWQFRAALRTIADVLHLNLGGDGPTQRLFPNLAFLGLFLLLINLTWF
ncbi:MAG: hypothetical protein AAFP16_07495 [Pseudomonadota bacterium]